METGRDREVKLIRKTNRAAAVGRLMLGEIVTWQEFLEADNIDLKKTPRKNLKGAVKDINLRLKKEVEKFCRKNFEDISQDLLSNLYEEIKQYRGIEMPLKEFEQKYAKIKKDVIKGCPPHLTINISLWGLKFQFPEEELSKDLAEGLKIAHDASKELKMYEKLSHAELLKKQFEIGKQNKLKKFGSRSVLISSFNLIEAYLNGLAWDYLQRTPEPVLSNTQRKLLNDSSQVSIRDKISKYPKIIAGQENWESEPPEIDEFINFIKPFRDSLVHPSPFTAPEKFGGYDKLKNLYSIDFDIAYLCSNLLLKIIEKIHFFIKSDEVTLPDWFEDLKKTVLTMENDPLSK